MLDGRSVGPKRIEQKGKLVIMQSVFCNLQENSKVSHFSFCIGKVSRYVYEVVKPLDNKTETILMVLCQYLYSRLVPLKAIRKSFCRPGFKHSFL